MRNTEVHVLHTVASFSFEDNYVCFDTKKTKKCCNLIAFHCYVRLLEEGTQRPAAGKPPGGVREQVWGRRCEEKTQRLVLLTGLFICQNTVIWEKGLDGTKAKKVKEYTPLTDAPVGALNKNTGDGPPRS